MRSEANASGPGDRVSLSLPAEVASVSLAETATRGLARQAGFPAAGATRLITATREAVTAGIGAARSADHLQVHYDVSPGVIVLTVELRRRARLRRNVAFVTSLAVAADGRAEGRPRKPRPVAGRR